MIKVVIFDIDGVILDVNFTELRKRFAERIGIDPARLDAYDQENKDPLFKGYITLEKFWDQMVEFGADPKTNFLSIWLEEGLQCTKCDFNLVEYIDSLRNKYTIGILSNLHFPRMCIDEEFNLYSHFDHVALSCIEQKRKPDVDFFKLILDRCDTVASETLFVDNNPKNIVPAQKMGIHCLEYQFGNSKMLKDFFDTL